MLVVVGMWAWVRFGRRITTPARHFLAMVIMSLLYFCIEKTLKFNNCLKIYLFNSFLYKNIKNLSLLWKMIHFFLLIFKRNVFSIFPEIWTLGKPWRREDREGWDGRNRDLGNFQKRYLSFENFFEKSFFLMIFFIFLTFRFLVAVVMGKWLVTEVVFIEGIFLQLMLWLVSNCFVDVFGFIDFLLHAKNVFLKKTISPLIISQ